MSITQQDVIGAFDYDPLTGVLTRIFKNGSRRIAKTLHRDGSIRVPFRGKTYRAHRLIWLYVYGYLPTLMIDHRNLDPSANWIDNLREATDGQNKCNVGMRSHNTSGFKGVTWDTVNRRWLAHATLNGKGVHLGRHSTKEAAANAYRDFARKHHGEFFRDPSL